MRAVRVLLGAVGVGVAAYGVSLLLDLGLGNLRATVEWVIGGVVLHDGVLAPLTIAIGYVVVRLGRGKPVPGPVVVAGLVLGTVTVAAIPVLGRFGARSDNPTLLDRHYVLGWAVLAAVVVGISLVAMLVRARRRS
ncbi:MAG: hypothetical protein ACJ716_09785 [Marmoricola sp.]